MGSILFAAAKCQLSQLFNCSPATARCSVQAGLSLFLGAGATLDACLAKPKECEECLNEPKISGFAAASWQRNQCPALLTPGGSRRAGIPLWARCVSCCFPPAPCSFTDGLQPTMHVSKFRASILGSTPLCITWSTEQSYLLLVDRYS